MANTPTQNPKKNNFVLMILLAITWVMMLQYMMGNKNRQQETKKPNPAAILQQADKDFRNKKYRDAFSGYDKAAGEFKGKHDGAIALLHKAQGQQRATGGRRTWIGTWSANRDEYGAVDTYRKLIAEYKNSKFPEVAQARREMHTLQLKMDEEASKHWMYQSMAALVNFGRSLHMGRYSYAFALFLVTIIVKLLTWKLSLAQYKGMRDMQRVQPIVKEIQEKYKGDPRMVNSKVMEAYKKEGVNPLMGCLPLIVQMPIMYIIWMAIRRYEFQFQHGTFLWINGYMHAHFATITVPILGTIPFIGANLSQPDIPLVILYTISMFITQKLTVVDPTQAEQQKIMSIMMPLVLTFVLWRFASAFLLYWVMLNIVMTAHQYYVLKQHAPAPAAAGAPQVVESPTLSPNRARPRRRKK